MTKQDSSGFAADGTDFRRASACIPGNDCVEVWVRADHVRVRDSQDAQAVELRLPWSGWGYFLTWQAHAR